MTMMNGFSDKIVEYLLTLPEGTEISTSEAADAVFGCTFTEDGEYKFGETIVTFEEYFDIHHAVHKKAKKKGLILDDSKYDDMVVGLLFNIPYVIKRKA